MTMGSVRTVLQEVAGVCVIKVGKELPVLQVRHDHIHTSTGSQ